MIVHSEEELLEELKKYPSEKIYVIGGESIYKMMLPYCDTVDVTKIDREFRQTLISRIWIRFGSGK